MNRFLTIFIIMLASASLFAATSAEAKRVGGGRSVGMQRQAISPQTPKAPTAQPQPAPNKAAPMAANPTPAPKPGISRWLGPLAAFGLGAALMSMFGGGAVMGALGNILMIVLLVVAGIFIFNMLRKKQTAQAAPMQYSTFPSSPPPVESYPPGSSGVGANFAPERRYPEGFDVEGFLRQAKVSFIRLQAANDTKDVQDIRDYTTPELYAELAMQIQERSGGEQKTEVVTLNADLLDVTVEEKRAIASVRFTGVIREEVDAGSTSIDETWHVIKDLGSSKSTWLIAGIEQNS